MDVFWFVIIYSLFVAPQQVEFDAWEEEPYDHSLDEFDEWTF
jgi:membrane protein YdbS with pleckstrin-like domain